MASTNPVTDFMGYTPTQKTSTSADNGLGKDTFMKLLVAQMRQQNPMEPTDDKEMINQMTQFSMLEQLQSLASSGEQSATAGHVSQAVSLIGHDVTYLNEDGTNGSGTVSSVNFVGGSPQLTIGDKSGITPSQVTQVR